MSPSGKIMRAWTLAAALAVSHAIVDTHSWAGAEYTPAKAPGNSLWWALYDNYASDVDFELGALSKLYGFNTLRMFMHSSVFDYDNGTTLLSSIDKFLTVATNHGFKSGLVFFDDCWAGSCPGGCNVTTPCVPTKGRHNGCWVQSPYMADRTNVTRFQPYVQSVVTRFKSDPRVLYWEVYNEPRNNDPFSMSLRSAAYNWITALQPQQPVLSCWDDNNATQAVDSHHYDTNFAALSSQVYQNPGKGGAITEGGSRWFQGYPLGGDAGSPKTFVTWLNNIRSITPSANAPFQFGLLQNWAMMVGGDNTRWHWNTPDGAPEPTIPWDSHLFPDGTPISHTEAALFRNWTLGRNDFLGYAGFLPQAWNYQGDSFVQLASGTGWVLGSDSVVSARTGEIAVDRSGSLSVPAGTLGDFVAETTVWPSNNTGGGMLLRAGVSPSTGEMTGYFVGFRNSGGAHPLLVAEAWGVDGSVVPLATPFDMSTLDCGLVIDGWNMLRASISTGATSGKTLLQVWANPMFPEAVAPGGIQPRITASIAAAAFPSGDLALVSVPNAIPQAMASTSVTRGHARVIEAPTMAEALQLDVDNKQPQGKMEVMALMKQRIAPVSTEAGEPRSLRAVGKGDNRPGQAGRLQDPPVVPPGYAAFDYVSALPLSVL